VIESEQQEIQWSQAARKIAQRARKMAVGQHVTLTGTKWHRGHEVADSDNWWLTLTSAKRAVTERFPNDWLDALGSAGNDELVAKRLSRMVQDLAGSSEPQVGQALAP
jgi:hypothetical protein